MLVQIKISFLTIFFAAVFATTSFAAKPGDVVINEVSWAGTRAHTSHQWVELFNTTDQSISIEGWVLTTTPRGPRVLLTDCGIFQDQGCAIPPQGYFLLESPDDSSISDIPADKIFRGTFDTRGSSLMLWDKDPGNEGSLLVDSANIDEGGWPGGDLRTRTSMERIDPFKGDTDDNWGTFCQVVPVIDPLDSLGMEILGTPGGENSLSLSVAAFEYEVARPTINQEVVFTATPSNCVIESYEWDLDGDGLPDHTGETASRYYPIPGKYRITLWVTDVWGTRIHQEKMLTVFEAPRANFEALFQSFPPERNTIQFVNTSFDHDGSIVKCEWDFAVDDETKTNLRETDRTSSSCTSRPVTYENLPDSNAAVKVSLSITDNDGFTDTITSTVSVPDSVKERPVAEFQALFQEYPPVSNVVQFVNHSSDVDGEIVSCHWEFAADTESERFLPIGKRTSDSCLPPPVTYEDIPKYQFPTKTQQKNDGDIFVAITESRAQWWLADGTYNKTLEVSPAAEHVTGMAFDSQGNLYVTGFNNGNVSVFESTGNLVGSFGGGYSGHPESILFDAEGNAFVGAVDGDNDIRKFSASGELIDQFDVETDGRGSDWINLAADQCTMFYTSEGKRILRYDVCTHTQLPDFVSDLDGSVAYGMRLLPGGGLLVANNENIKRLDASGNVIKTYDASGKDEWFALNVDPDGKSFWSADIETGHIHQFDIESGETLFSFNASDSGEKIEPGSVGGLIIRGELTAATSFVPTKVKVALTVTDNDGLTDTATEVITFPDPVFEKPRANFDVLFHEYPPFNNIVQFVNRSVDLDGVVVTCLWNFAADSMSEGYLPEEQRISESCNPPPVTYQNLPQENAVVTVSLLVTDDSGITDTVTRTIAFPPITDSPPSKSLSCQIGLPDGEFFVGEEVSFEGSCVDQDGQALESSSVNWEWDFGDGAKSNDGPAVVHAYENEGNYRVLLKALYAKETYQTSLSVKILSRAVEPPTENDIVLLVDISGSVNSDTLEAVLREFIKQMDSMLDSNSRLEVVTYDLDVTVNPNPTTSFSPWPEQRDNLLKWIDQGLVTRSMSYLELGLETALDRLEEYSRPDAHKSIFVITQGPPIPLMHDADALIRRSNQLGVTIQGLGIMGELWNEETYNALRMIIEGSDGDLIMFDERKRSSLEDAVGQALFVLHTAN